MEIYCWHQGQQRWWPSSALQQYALQLTSVPKKQGFWKSCGEVLFPLQITVYTVRSQKDAMSWTEWRPPLSSREDFSEHIGLKTCRWSGVKKNCRHFLLSCQHLLPRPVLVCRSLFTDECRHRNAVGVETSLKIPATA